jgi:hypothetical protein
VEDILPATAQQVKIGSGNIRLDSAVRCQVLSFLSLVLCFKSFLAWATTGSSIILPRTAVTPLPEFSKRLQILRLRRQSVECFSTSTEATPPRFMRQQRYHRSLSLTCYGPGDEALSSGCDHRTLIIINVTPKIFLI